MSAQNLDNTKLDDSNLSVPDTVKESQSVLLNFLKNVSCQQFSIKYASATNQEFVKPTNLSADHWVASVILPMAKVSVAFRVHFTSVQGRKVLATTKLKEDLISPKNAHDSLKEYCNIVMGKLKAAIADEMQNGEMSNVFVPEMSPSYDNFGTVPTGDVVKETWWRLVWEGGELICYGKAVTKGGFSPKTLEELNKDVSVVSFDDEGDVDFFDF